MCIRDSLYATANEGLTTIPDAINFPVSDEYQGTRVGAPKGETELIEVVNKVIEELNESGPVSYTHLHQCSSHLHSLHQSPDRA